MGCGCGDCEEMMQPYMDKVLSDEQMREAQEHLEACPPCEKRASGASPRRSRQ